MISPSFVVLVILLTFAVERIYSLRKNINKAREVGLPYVTVPLYTATPLWYFVYPYILPSLKLLPLTWTYPWLDFLDPYWSWNLHHEPFARLGSDTILVVAPGGLIFCTCDPNIITEVATRRNDFCKPVESYVFLDVFGPSIVTLEGEEWRTHQKLLGPAFSDHNVRLVFDESVVQAQDMLASWIEMHDKGGKRIESIRLDTMLLPFNVINRAGFGVRIPWAKDQMKGRDPIDVDKITSGHTLSYRQALLTAISHLFHILMFPDQILRLLPFHYPTLLRRARRETIGYLKKLVEDTDAALSDTPSDRGPEQKVDILSALIRTRLDTSSKKAAATSPTAMMEPMSEDSMLSNLFVMLIAGHETTATILISMMMELALHPDWQHELQIEVDRISADRSISMWSVYEEIKDFQNGRGGATINEVLRLYPPANIIPKGTREGEPRTLYSAGDPFTVPENTAFQFVANSVHRNPKVWPQAPDTKAGCCDLDQFKPKRWITVDGKLLQPIPGSFIAFSVGQRQCIGRRFAQVELIAVLAVLCKSYSLEIDTSCIVEDEVLAKMTKSERQDVWKEGAKRMQKVLRAGMRHHLTMQHMIGEIPIRLVRRGQEVHVFSD